MTKTTVITNCVFLDTSIFIKENFLAGHKLKAFIQHVHNGDIELFTTDITTREILRLLPKRFKSDYRELEKTLRTLGNKAKTLKNIPALAPNFFIPSGFSPTVEYDKLETEMKESLDTNFTLIEIDNDLLPKVLDDYFEINPPFQPGVKEKEFPDALVLNTLNEWCKKRGKKMYVVSTDSDMIAFKSSHLRPVEAYDELLEQISYTFSEENVTDQLDDILAESSPEILKEVSQAFEHNFNGFGDDLNQGFEYEAGLDITDKEIDHVTVLVVNDNVATLQVEVLLYYDLDISYTDTSEAWYDKEDSIFIGGEHRHKKTSDSVTIDCIIKVHAEMPGKPSVYPNWELEEITSGMDLEIYLEPGPVQLATIDSTNSAINSETSNPY